MNRSDAITRRCPFGVADKCLAEGCMAWVGTDVTRRMQLGSAPLGAERDREARRQQQELRDAGFGPVAPNTYHIAANGERIPLNWRSTSRDCGECGRLRGCPPASQEES